MPFTLRTCWFIRTILGQICFSVGLSQSMLLSLVGWWWSHHFDSADEIFVRLIDLILAIDLTESRGAGHSIFKSSIAFLSIFKFSILVVICHLLLFRTSAILSFVRLGDNSVDHDCAAGWCGGHITHIITLRSTVIFSLLLLLHLFIFLMFFYYFLLKI